LTYVKIKICQIKIIIYKYYKNRVKSFLNMGSLASRQHAGVEEVDVVSNHAYKYPPRSGTIRCNLCRQSFLTLVLSKGITLEVIL
jgi:hypothetical protein